MAKGTFGSESGANVLVASICEFLGTAVLVAVGTGVAITAALQVPADAGPLGPALSFVLLLGVALAFGLTLMGLVYWIGPLSGCHVNPALTLGLTITDNLPWKNLVPYVVAQFAGGYCGSMLILKMLGPATKQAAMGATAPAKGFTNTQTFLVELCVTFLLMSVVMAVATDGRGPDDPALAVGLTLTVCIMFAGFFTGGGVNPARAFGPMLVSGNLSLSTFWPYLAGPIAGAAIAALLYEHVLSKAEAPAAAPPEPPQPSN